MENGADVASRILGPCEICLRDGNHLSWRGWGRGFNSIPDEDDDLFEARIARGRQIMRQGDSSE